MIDVPSPVDNSAAENVCSDTTAGWLWYCDEHDTHGNADTEEEAQLLAGTHELFWEAQQDEDEDPCPILVWRRTPHERATEWPECPEHREIQHRDGQPPWCHACGWNRGRPAIPPRKLGTPR